MARQRNHPLHDGDVPQTSFAQAPPRPRWPDDARCWRSLPPSGPRGSMLATPAAPAGPLALGVRFGNSPATVRVVVDLTGSRIPIGRIEPALDDIYATGTANFVVDIGGTGSRVSTAGGLGVRVASTRNHNRLTIHTSAASGRFKYVRWSTLGGPSRIVIDLWTAAPPTGAATVPNYRCLSLHAVSPSPGVVAVAGSPTSIHLREPVRRQRPRRARRTHRTRQRHIRPKSRVARMGALSRCHQQNRHH